MKPLTITPGTLAWWRIQPDKALTNGQVETLARALWETYTPPQNRIRLDRTGLTIDRPPRIAWEVQAGETLTWRLGVPTVWTDYAGEKLHAIWPHATTLPDQARLEAFAAGPISAAELRLKRHYLYSLSTDSRNEAPLPGICRAGQDLHPGEAFLVQLVAEPEDDGWTVGAADAYEQHKAGRPPRPARLDPKDLLQRVAFAAAAAGQIVADVTQELITEEETNTELAMTDQSRIIKQALSHATLSKAGQVGFRCSLRLLVAAPSEQRRTTITRALAAAYKGLAADNEWERVDVQPRRLPAFLRAIERREIPAWRLDPNILSAQEVARHLQLPPAAMQAQFPRIDSLAFREIGPAARLTAGGLHIGTVTHQGKTVDVSWPTDDADELNLPRTIIGEMGSGKSTAGAQLAIAAADAGHSVFVIDPADGEMVDRIRDGVRDPSKLRILDFGRIDYPIGLDWHEAAGKGNLSNRLAAECASFYSRWVDETGGRTRRWLRAAAQAVYSRPNSTLLEVVLMLISESYRAETIAGLTDPMLRETWEHYHGLKETAQAVIYGPILNRLDYLLDDQALRNVLCQPSLPEVDFRRWADDGSVVLLKVPKGILGDAATDALVAYLVRKIWLAILTRQDQPIAARRTAFLLLDEPHQYMTGSRELWNAMTVEARKWRLAVVWMFHSFSAQFPRDLRQTIEAAGPHYLLLTTSKATYEELEEEIKPYTVEEALETPRHWALARIRSGGEVVTPFLVRLAPPPKRIEDRSHLDEEHARRYGRPVAAVEADILRREQAIYRAMMGGQSNG